MTDLVVDASVVVKWYLDEPGSEAARLLQGKALELAAPRLLPVEVANVLWKYIRKGSLDARTGIRILATLADAPIDWHDTNLLTSEALVVAAETGRTVYDCLYLALAVRCDCPMITADRKLYNALKEGTYGARLLWIEDVT